MKTKHVDFKDAEKKDIAMGFNYRKRMGRSSCILICPFCKHHQTVYIWSYSAIGKRCDGCGAMMIHRIAFKKKSEECGFVNLARSKELQKI